MKNMKKLLTLLLVVGTIASLTSCSKKDPYLLKDGSFNTSKLLDLSVKDVECRNGCVAAANPYAAHAGLSVLLKGGNAFDAAIATSFALGVVEPHCSGIAGGGIMVGYNAKTKKFVSYNFREIVPGKGKSSVYKSADEMENGIRSAGVPTYVQSLLGIMDAQGNFKNTAEGRETVIGPARDLAKNGFIITPELANAISGSSDAWKGNKNDLPEDYIGTKDSYDEQAYEIFSDDGLAYDEGETMVNPNLANVYDEVIANGSDGFYKGWVAEAMLEAQNDYSTYILDAGSGKRIKTANSKGLWTQEDFDYIQENYPKEVNPLSTTYGDYDIVTATCPSSGGIILAEGLNMLEAFKSMQSVDQLKDLGGEYSHNSPEYINLIATVTQLGYGDKQKYIGDTSINPATGKPFIDVPVEGLLNKEYAANRFIENYTPGKCYNGKFTQLRTTNTGGTVEYQNYGDPWKYCEKGSYSSEVRYTPEEERNPSWSTTSFSCADKDGNIVSVTQTINHFFGAKLMPKGCGFFLNNQLSSFSLKTSSASYVEPYKHPTSHIMPTIILKDGNPYATLGSPGSMRLVTAVFTTVVNMLDWDMDIQSAINAARAYNYCASDSATASDNGEGSGMGDDSHKALYLEIADEITEETAETLSRDYSYAVNLYEGKNLFFGGVQGITFANGKMHGGADIRRDGKALGY